MSTTSTDGTYTRTAELQDSYPGRGDDVRRDVYVTLSRDGLDVVTMAWTAVADEAPDRRTADVTRTWDAAGNETRSLTALTVEVMLTARAELDTSKHWHEDVPEDTTVADGQAAEWLAEEFP